MDCYNRRKNPDSQVQQVLNVLIEYERAHPNALIEARRGNYDFILIRIIDPDLNLMARSEREDTIWLLLDKLPGKIISNIGSLVLVTPEEAPYSGSSIEFDHPLPPLPIPNFSEEMPEATNGHQNETISIPLQLEEAEAVKQLAFSQGVSDGALIQGWVREKIKLSEVHATA